jgi:hypothetical protein
VTIVWAGEQAPHRLIGKSPVGVGQTERLGAGDGIANRVVAVALESAEQLLDAIVGKVGESVGDLCQ